MSIHPKEFSFNSSEAEKFLRIGKVTTEIVRLTAEIPTGYITVNRDGGPREVPVTRQEVNFQILCLSDILSHQLELKKLNELNGELTYTDKKLTYACKGNGLTEEINKLFYNDFERLLKAAEIEEPRVALKIEEQTVRKKMEEEQDKTRNDIQKLHLSLRNYSLLHPAPVAPPAAPLAAPLAAPPAAPPISWKTKVMYKASFLKKVIQGCEAALPVIKDVSRQVADNGLLATGAFMTTIGGASYALFGEVPNGAILATVAFGAIYNWTLNARQFTTP